MFDPGLFIQVGILLASKVGAYLSGTPLNRQSTGLYLTNLFLITVSLEPTRVDLLTLLLSVGRLLGSYSQTYSMFVTY